MKALIAILTVVAIASLAVNFLLIYRLHQTGETAKKWKKAPQKENQELYRAEKQRSASQTTRTSQPENIASLP
jgi:hypothetical protein